MMHTVAPVQPPHARLPVTLLNHILHNREGRRVAARQERVLIGLDMDEDALRARLDDCLLTDAEMASGPQAWVQWDKPFPGRN